jgi:uncharacterized membrane protein
MKMLEMFRDGGWGMFPTLLFGLVLLAVSLRFARAPSQRLVPLLVALNWLTITAGALGFISGVIATCGPLSEGISDTSRIAFEGVGESLYNVAFALLFAMVAAVAATLGAWKLAREREIGGAARAA